MWNHYQITSVRASLVLAFVKFEQESYVFITPISQQIYVQCNMYIIYSYHSQHPLKILRPRLHPGNPLVPALGRQGSHNWCFHLAQYHMFLRDSPQDACRKGNGSKLSPRFEVFYLSKDSLQRHEWCDKWISKGRSKGGAGNKEIEEIDKKSMLILWHPCLGWHQRNLRRVPGARFAACWCLHLGICHTSIHVAWRHGSLFDFRNRNTSTIWPKNLWELSFQSWDLKGQVSIWTTGKVKYPKKHVHGRRTTLWKGFYQSTKELTFPSRQRPLCPRCPTKVHHLILQTWHTRMDSGTIIQ